MKKRHGADRNNGGSPRGRLRIVAGKWRGRLLSVADVTGLRPTPERVRETVFNWLAPRIQTARCLDLFAGTGALGFEALSRGAPRVEFVEVSAKAAATIRQNISLLEALDARLTEGDAMGILRSGIEEPYDVIFLDPPFADDNLAELCRLLHDNGFVTAGSYVYLEQPQDRSIPVLPAGFNVRREKTAGNVRYALLEIAVP
jgi:16S rRNA (guanine966-N2)-methyltransferase